MRAFLIAVLTVLISVVFGFNHAMAQEKDVCLKLIGEKIEIHNLGTAREVIIDREDLPDFAPTSMVTGSHNILLSGIKRDDRNAIISFDVKADEKTYSYPKDSCRN